MPIRIKQRPATLNDALKEHEKRTVARIVADAAKAATEAGEAGLDPTTPLDRFPASCPWRLRYDFEHLVGAAHAQLAVGSVCCIGRDVCYVAVRTLGSRSAERLVPEFFIQLDRDGLPARVQDNTFSSMRDMLESARGGLEVPEVCNVAGQLWRIDDVEGDDDANEEYRFHCLNSWAFPASVCPPSFVWDPRGLLPPWISATDSGTARTPVGYGDTAIPSDLFYTSPSLHEAAMSPIPVGSVVQVAQGSLFLRWDTVDSHTTEYMLEHNDLWCPYIFLEITTQGFPVTTNNIYTFDSVREFRQFISWQRRQHSFPMPIAIARGDSHEIWLVSESTDGSDGPLEYRSLNAWAAWGSGRGWSPLVREDDEENTDETTDPPADLEHQMEDALLRSRPEGIIRGEPPRSIEGVQNFTIDDAPQPVMTFCGAQTEISLDELLEKITAVEALHKKTKRAMILALCGFGSTLLVGIAGIVARFV